MDSQFWESEGVGAQDLPSPVISRDEAFEFLEPVQNKCHFGSGRRFSLVKLYHEKSLRVFRQVILPKGSLADLVF